jgi:hypothetical protein
MTAPAKANTPMTQSERTPRTSGERITILLGVILIAATVGAGYGIVGLLNSREAASAAQSDLKACQADLADLAMWRAGRTTGAPTTAQDPELNRRLSAAALAAGIPNELASIEPATPVRVNNTDYTRTRVFVRLNAVTLRELSAFLKDLAASDAAVKTESIELQAPEQPAQRPGELWTSDLTLGYLTYASRGREAR